MKKIFFIIPFCLLANIILAQSIERQVIGAAGQGFSNATTTMSFTVGEVFTTSLTDGVLIFNQGFQQGEWVACSETTTYTSSGWNPSAPTSNTRVIIASDYDTAIVGASIDACEIVINSGITLTVSAGDYAKVENNITVNGNLIVAHEGSVVQVDDVAIVANNGLIEVNKTTPVLPANMFSIIGSPMTTETRDGVFTNSNVVMTHNTLLFSPHQDVTDQDPLAENFADDNGDNWSFFTANEDLSPGVGYLVGPPTGGGAIDVVHTQGTLTNGITNFTAIYNTPGPTADDNQNASPNILSNPYASAINTIAFINDNSIVDAVYFWEHITQPTSSYPGYRSENWDMGDISMHNGIMGAPAPNGGNTPTQFIPSAQGFGIKANATGTVLFNNAMRVTGPNTGYRNTETPLDKLYLKVENETYHLKSFTGIGFTEIATDGYDPKLDTKRLATPISLYTVLEEKELALQGRSVFNEEHTIPLGFRTMVEEEQNYIISIGSLEGDLISSVSVFLIDNSLETITNLSEENYTFSSNVSNQKGRFVIVFNYEILDTNNSLDALVSIFPNPTKGIVTISSPLSTIQQIEIFDLSGRRIKSIKTNNLSNYNVNLSDYSSAVYVLKINTDKGSLTKRIIKH